MRAILLASATATTLKGRRQEVLREPEIFLRILLGAPQDGMRADDKNAPQVAVALLGDRPASACPRLILSRHQSDPSAKSRPDRKTVGSATVAAIALAPMTPMPGMVSSRLLASFERCCVLILFLDRSDQRLHGLEALPAQ